VVLHKSLVSPALRRLRQEDHQVQASLGYAVRPYVVSVRYTSNKSNQKLTASPLLDFLEVGCLPQACGFSLAFFSWLWKKKREVSKSRGLSPAPRSALGANSAGGPDPFLCLLIWRQREPRRVRCPLHFQLKRSLCYPLCKHLSLGNKKHSSNSSWQG
jgi:hypothetical protein